MTLDDQNEQFSFVYSRAVAAVAEIAGYAVCQGPRLPKPYRLT